MRSLERVQAALNFTVPDCTPIFLNNSGFVAKSMGVSFKKYLQDADTLVTTYLMGLREFKTDIVNVFLDSCVEAEALGSEVTYSETEYPTIAKPLLKNWQEMDKLSVPDPWVAGRMPLVLQATQRIVDQDNGEHFIVGQVLGPITIATQIYGIENLLYLIVDEPEGVLQLLQFTSQVTERYVEALVSAGVDGVILHDPSASPDVVSNRLFSSLVAPQLQRLIQRIQAKKRTTLWLQIIGNTTSVLPLINDFDVQMVTLDSMVDLPSALTILENKAVVGNMNPLVFRQATQEQLSQTLEDIAQQSRDKGYILGPGCEVPLDARLENVRLLSKLVGRG